jgi:Galactoside-binding lectin
MSVVCTVHLYSVPDIGHFFVISGVLKKSPKTFKINFLLRDDDSEIETPLSISCNLNDKLMNVKSLTSQTLDRGKVIRVEEFTEKFKFNILMLDKSFNISFNNQKLCKYDYKSDLKNIKVVRIFGDVDSVKQVDHRKTYPAPWPLLHEDLSSIAFSCDVACKYSPYSIIVLRGKISGNPKGSFFIRFNEFGSKKQLFHFNPRFDEEIIIVNSMNDDLE